MVVPLDTPAGTGASRLRAANSSTVMTCIGAMYIALKEMKAKGGPFDEAAKWRLPRDVSATLINQAEWLARAQKYGVVR